MVNLIISISLGIIAVACLVLVIAQLRSEITRLNVKLDLIAKHLGVSGLDSVNINEELKSLILEGKRIEAITKYRTVASVGLKEAYDYIEELNKE